MRLLRTRNSAWTHAFREVLRADTQLRDIARFLKQDTLGIECLIAVIAKLRIADIARDVIVLRESCRELQARRKVTLLQRIE
jgi:hypothetical protein